MQDAQSDLRDDTGTYVRKSSTIVALAGSFYHLLLRGYEIYVVHIPNFL